jgi:superfamily II DNA or RNA helicase
MPRPSKSASTHPVSTPRRPTAEPRLSRSRKPEPMSVEAWQAGLRRQFGREQDFELEPLDVGTAAGWEFSVGNPQRATRYRVAIRNARAGENFCACPDFATNDLGTCKHVEFALARLSARRGGKAALERGFQPPFSEVYLRYGAVRRLCFRAGIECPPALAGKGAALFGDGADPAAGLDAFLRAARKAGHEVRFYEDARAFVARQRDAVRRCEALDAAFPKGAQSPALRKLLKVPLYSYQAEGALFAARAGRSLIGDDMGLGKTIQAIAAAELLTRHAGAERVLIVCPVSLKHQWQREIARFSGRAAEVVRGPREARRAQWADVREPGAWAKITNYETLARDLDLINAWAPDVVIADEAQRIKNWDAVAARALKQVASPHAIVLTGTPLQNRLEELISIVQFVDPHRLGPTWRLLDAHQLRDEAGRVIGYRDLDRIGATLAAVMLRRRKSEVLDQLPERVESTLFVPMTQQQLACHAENGDVVARIVKRWRQRGFLSDIDQRVLTCALQNMRMSCNSTYLLDHETDHGTKVDELMTLLEECLEQPGAKVVVFSQWVRTHELIVRRLQARRWGHVLFHGGVPSEQRPALIDRFHADPDCRLFLSTDAGSVGLNLQHAAATIVNMDLPWNPAVLEQRIGRVHRLGQRGGVQVFNFVAQGSIEQGMLSVLAFKKSLSAGVLDGGESDIFLQGTRLAKFMSAVDEVTGSMGSAETAAPVPAEPEAAPAPAVVEAAGDGGPETGEGPAPDPWAALVDAGLRLLDALSPREAGGSSTGLGASIERDRATGRDVLRIPLPQPQTLARLAQAVGGLLARLPRDEERSQP